MSENRTPERLAVAKTYKLSIGGSFHRSESGRSYPVHDASGRFLANAAQASRKDVRDAVAAARKAFSGWSGATAYNRGQVIFRIAEVLEGRRDQFVAEITAAEGLSAEQANSTVDTAVDRLVWYAGWTDKIAAVLGAANPVAGPYFSFSVPEPTGVVGVLAPLPAITFAEVLATSDVPGGVVNVLTGQLTELVPWLASHADVNALDLTGAPESLHPELERAASDTVKRVLPVRGEPDWRREPDIQRLRAFTETTTVWHPVGT
jgi:acyl-CoA reductase-like NAD-dependent aldehyde dehydrogenase